MSVCLLHASLVQTGNIPNNVMIFYTRLYTRVLHVWNKSLRYQWTQCSRKNVSFVFLKQFSPLHRTYKVAFLATLHSCHFVSRNVRQNYCFLLRLIGKIFCLLSFKWTQTISLTKNWEVISTKKNDVAPEIRGSGNIRHNRFVPAEHATTITCTVNSTVSRPLPRQGWFEVPQYLVYASKVSSYPCPRRSVDKLLVFVLKLHSCGLAHCTSY